MPRSLPIPSRLLKVVRLTKKESPRGIGYLFCFFRETRSKIGNWMPKPF